MLPAIFVGTCIVIVFGASLGLRRLRHRLRSWRHIRDTFSAVKTNLSILEVDILTTRKQVTDLHDHFPPSLAAGPLGSLASLNLAAIQTEIAELERLFQTRELPREDLGWRVMDLTNRVNASLGVLKDIEEAFRRADGARTSSIAMTKNLPGTLLYLRAAIAVLDGNPVVSLDATLTNVERALAHICDEMKDLAVVVDWFDVQGRVLRLTETVTTIERTIVALPAFVGFCSGVLHDTLLALPSLLDEAMEREHSATDPDARQQLNFACQLLHGARRYWTVPNPDIGKGFLVYFHARQLLERASQHPTNVSCAHPVPALS